MFVFNRSLAAVLLPLALLLAVVLWSNAGDVAAIRVTQPAQAPEVADHGHVAATLAASNDRRPDGS